ncbi:MAG: class I SAM-dependent methyltransferase [Gemmatimonadales bacterium]
MTRVCGDVRRLPIGDETVDAIVSLSTLDHFESPDDVATSLGELFRVLRPGGILVLTLDNLANPVVALRNRLPFRLTHAIGLVPYPTGTTYGPRAAQERVGAAGFEIAECTTIMHAPRVLAIPLMNALAALRSSRVSAVLSRMAMAFETLQGLPSRL